MKIVGLTGAIGSGKSYIASLFGEFGVPVYNSDVQAKIIIHQNETVRSEIIQLLGKNAYDELGNYNTKYVASIVFQDKNLLKKLNNIVHHHVLLDSKMWAAQNQDKPYVIKESALIFETNIHRNCYKTICVVAPERVRIARVLARDNNTENEVRARMKQQFSQEKKCALADFMVLNNGKTLLLPQVYSIHQSLLKLIDD